MNRKVMVYFIGLVWVAVLLQIAVIIGTQNDKKAVQAFQSADSVPVQSRVVVSGTYKDYLVTKQDREKLCRFIMKNLGVDNYHTSYEMHGENQEMVLSSNNDTAVTKVVFWEENETQSLTVSVTLNQKIDRIIEVKEKIEEGYRKLHIDPVTSFSMEGMVSGKMNHTQMEQCKDEIFKVLEAQNVTKQNVSGAKIYYGFSRRLGNTKKTRSEKMNVQLVFAYDEQKAQTNLYLGVPFLDGNF